METKCELLLFLDRKDVLVDMKAECLKFLQKLVEKPSQSFLPFRYLLDIDVMKLINEFPDVGQLLLVEPNTWQIIASEILFFCVQSLILNHNQDYQVQRAQVTVILRLNHLPRLLVRPNLHYYSSLVSFEGIITWISKPSSYVSYTVWSCFELCEGNEVILQHIPKLPPRCEVCRSVLFENSGMRICGEKVSITILQKNCILSKTLTIVDDLIPKLRQGSMYVITGTVMKKMITVLAVEEANNVPAPLTTLIPSDIRKLFLRCNKIPWEFIYCLALRLGINVCPLSCFMHLKISLLLSLASIKASILTGSSLLHVLVAGLDTGYVGHIMNEAAKLADRQVFIGTTNTVVYTSLVASSGGVCVMPLPLHTYNVKQTSAILSALECSEISTDNGRVKLQSAVWGQGVNLKTNAFFNVASVFGFVCRGDNGEYNDEIVEFVLQNAIEPLETTEEENKTLKDVSKYLDLIAGLTVSLDTAAERLLRSYFLAARKKSPRGVSVGSMTALVTVSLTSARICRRTIANIDDAVFAIWLHVSGSPEPRFAPEEYLDAPDDVKKLQKIMNKFKEWLEQFVGHIICIL